MIEGNDGNYGCFGFFPVDWTVIRIRGDRRPPWAPKRVYCFHRGSEPPSETNLPA